MIKKSVFEDELIAGMQHELQAHEKKQGIKNLVKAADYLHSALDILEESGLTAQAEEVLKILSKIAEDNQEAHLGPHQHKKPKNPLKIHDPHTKGLTPEKQVKNLLHHGTPFNMADDGKADDLLNLDIDDQALEITEGPSDHKDFEDED